MHPLFFTTQQTGISFVIFVAVKIIRSISPFISVLLMMLILSGSLGYTLVRHTCQHCGTDEVVATFTGNGEENGCCCSHAAGVMHHPHSTYEMIISDDCCSHEAERVVTDELLRAEVQNEILPYFLAATVVAVIQDQPLKSVHQFVNNKSFHCGHDLTTMHCQIIS
jgi:hypothetical protein